jgi:hypothetical protein
MTDFVLVAAQLPTPIKLAWALWMMWIVLQVAMFRWMRQEAPSAPEPAPELALVQPLPAAVATRSRRRRRRRPAEAHEPGALQEIGA